MSGTPPPRPPTEIPQLAGQRRKREYSPPLTSTQVTQPSATRIETSSFIEHTTQRYGQSPRIGAISDYQAMPATLPAPWEQSSGYSVGNASPYALVTSSLPPRPQPAQVSPRATRKVKAHVASACVNCKQKHLRCDNTRPCRRCVQTGKEDTCRDVEHKKRGRPPLKPDDTQGNRPQHSSMSLPPLSSGIGRPVPGPTLAPLVPLLPTPAPRMSYAPPYSHPSIAQSSVQGTGTMIPPSRPPSFPPMSRNPPMGPQSNQFRGYPAYGYTLPGPGLADYPGSEYSTSVYPRTLPSQPAMDPVVGGYGVAPYQLPPILPAPPGTNIDPAIAQQQRHLQPQFQQYSHPYPSRYTHAQDDRDPDEHDRKRPRMDIRGILGPRE